MRLVQKHKWFLGFSFSLMAVVLLSGCRSEEQGRVIMYEPGVYKGMKHNELSADEVQALRSRAANQAGANSPASGGAAKTGRASAIDAGALSQRTASQGGA